MTGDPSFEAPLAIAGEDTVRPEWIDYNGHMNVAYYLLAFDQALDRLYDRLGMGRAYRDRTGHSSFSLESHLTYQRELRLGEPFRFTAQLLDCDAKRTHFFGVMRHAREGFVAATHEWISLHVDLEARRGVAMPAAIQSQLEALLDAHAHLPRPAEAGRPIGIRRATRP